MVLAPGTFLVSGLTIPQNMTLRLIGSGSGGIGSTTLKASSTAPILTISDTTAGTAAAHIVLESLRIDGNAKAANGLRILKAQNFIARDVTFRYCDTAIHIDGAANQRVLNVSFENCITEYNNYGARMVEPQPRTTSFSIFRFNGHASESDGEAFVVDGDLMAMLDGCEVQNSGTVAFRVRKGQLTIDKTYVEAHPNGQHVIGTEGARLSIRDSLMADRVSLDATSRMTVNNSHVNGYGRSAAIYSTGQMADDTSWGSPNLEVAGKIGAHYQKGFRYTDAYGVEWVCTLAASSGDAKFVAPGGRIVIPITFTDLSNAKTLWWPNEDFIWRDLMLVVTSTFAGPAGHYIGIGNSANYPSSQQAFISFAQGATDNLVMGAVMTAQQNVHAGAVLSGGRGLYVPGASPWQGSTTLNRLVMFTSGGTWTAGSALLIGRGEFLKYA